ncbi:MAG: glycoside hydrolase family 16 protein [Spirochaetaceae bacterium]|nr:MAG: glycoside hydrolase family 16 protein [Spirochaetaceae bacterium]
MRSFWPLIVATIILGATVSCATSRDSVETGVREVEWELVWSDEFDYTGLPDPERWSYETGMVRNNEAQYYVPRSLSNSRVEDGRLVIEAHKQRFGTAEYTSASIHTRFTQSWTYGRFEIRAKVPAGRGTWPAAWLLGSNIGLVGWPMCGEIDIMEYVGFDPRRVHGYVHTFAYNHTRGTQRGSSLMLPSPYDTFHVYAIEWFPDRIDFYVDDQKYFTFHNEGTGADVWPFDEPHYLILNLAIGGSWGGQRGIDDSIFPARYEIEYVRVYQMAR